MVPTATPRSLSTWPTPCPPACKPSPMLASPECAIPVNPNNHAKSRAVPTPSSSRVLASRGCHLTRPDSLRDRRRLPEVDQNVGRPPAHASTRPAAGGEQAKDGEAMGRDGDQKPKTCATMCEAHACRSMLRCSAPEGAKRPASSRASALQTPPPPLNHEPPFKRVVCSRPIRPRDTGQRLKALPFSSFRAHRL